VQVYKQKVKHLMYEHENAIAVLKADAEEKLNLAHEDETNREQALLRDKRVLKQELKDQAPPSDYYYSYMHLQTLMLRT
jgi:hypothetical protein